LLNKEVYLFVYDNTLFYYDDVMLKHYDSLLEYVVYALRDTIELLSTISIDCIWYGTVSGWHCYCVARLCNANGYTLLIEQWTI